MDWPTLTMRIIANIIEGGLCEAHFLTKTLTTFFTSLSYGPFIKLHWSIFHRGLVRKSRTSGPKCVEYSLICEFVIFHHTPSGLDRNLTVKLSPCCLKHLCATFIFCNCIFVFAVNLLGRVIGMMFGLDCRHQ